MAAEELAGDVMENEDIKATITTAMLAWFDSPDSRIEKDISKEQFSLDEETVVGFVGGFMAATEEVESLKAEIDRLKDEIERKDAALRSSLSELESLWSLYGQGLTVYGWHLNGDGEALDDLFDANSVDAMDKIKNALTKTEEEG